MAVLKNSKQHSAISIPQNPTTLPLVTSAPSVVKTVNPGGPYE
jgi:hypothetical protein